MVSPWTVGSAKMAIWRSGMRALCSPAIWLAVGESADKCVLQFLARIVCIAVKSASDFNRCFFFFFGNAHMARRAENFEATLFSLM